jgi:hypothetical protein
MIIALSLIGWGLRHLQDDAEEEALKARTGCVAVVAQGTTLRSKTAPFGHAERDAWPGAAGSEEKALSRGHPDRDTRQRNPRHQEATVSQGVA